MPRKLSPEFILDLQENGMLHPLLMRVLIDDTLMLAIRNNYINIYYRGGNIIQLEEKSKHQYEASFDENYAKPFPDLLLELPEKLVGSKTSIEQWIKSIPSMKQAMDFWFHKNIKSEREFQQLIARENNYSNISNDTEYFIADIELTDVDIGARFDMLAFKWPAEERTSGKIQLALVEMKYGDDTLCGKSGILAHFNQMSAYLTDDIKRTAIADMATEQINQLNTLGLIQHTKGKAREFKVDASHFEVIYIFANHNPRSTVLLGELKKLREEWHKTANKMFDLRFFISSTAGYAMHIKCMKDINGYIEFLEFLNPGNIQG